MVRLHDAGRFVQMGDRLGFFFLLFKLSFFSFLDIVE